LIAHGEYLLERDRLGAFANLQNALSGPLHPFPVNLQLRNKAGYLLAVAHYDDAFSTLNAIEEAQKVSLGLRCLNCLHKFTTQFY
jgi:hypothetical protein